MKGSVRSHGNLHLADCPAHQGGVGGANMVSSRNARCLPKSTLRACGLFEISVQTPANFVFNRVKTKERTWGEQMTGRSSRSNW